jgi:hypothetical protein
MGRVRPLAARAGPGPRHQRAVAVRRAGMCVDMQGRTGKGMSLEAVSSRVARRIDSEPAIRTKRSIAPVPDTRDVRAQGDSR